MVKLFKGQLLPNSNQDLGFATMNYYLYLLIIIREAFEIRFEAGMFRNEVPLKLTLSVTTYLGEFSFYNIVGPILENMKIDLLIIVKTSNL